MMRTLSRIDSSTGPGWDEDMFRVRREAVESAGDSEERFLNNEIALRIGSMLAGGKKGCQP